MSESNLRMYDGLFLFQQSASSDLGSAIGHVRELLDRADAELVALRKWDERRLAYEINKQRRGVYLLVYFRAAPPKLVNLERDCNLSELIMRYMITRADHLSIDEIKALDDQDALAVQIKLKAASEQQAASAAAEKTKTATAKEKDTQPEPAGDSGTGVAAPAPEKAVVAVGPEVVAATATPAATSGAEKLEVLHDGSSASAESTTADQESEPPHGQEDSTRDGQ